MKFKRVLVFLVLVTYLISIYFLSDQTGIEIERLSEKVREKVESFVTLPQEISYGGKVYTMDYHYVFSKVTHFILYSVLAAITYILFSSCSISFKSNFLITLLLSILFAVLDEFHQSFVTNRTSSIRDVLIDSFGVLTSLMIIFLIRSGVRKACCKYDARVKNVLYVKKNH